jgi:hypothetical protein
MQKRLQGCKLNLRGKQERPRKLPPKLSKRDLRLLPLKSNSKLRDLNKNRRSWKKSDLNKKN